VAALLRGSPPGDAGYRCSAQQALVLLSSAATGGVARGMPAHAFPSIMNIPVPQDQFNGWNPDTFPGCTNKLFGAGDGTAMMAHFQQQAVLQQQQQYQQLQAMHQLQVMQQLQAAQQLGQVQAMQQQQRQPLLQQQQPIGGIHGTDVGLTPIFAFFPAKTAPLFFDGRPADRAPLHRADPASLGLR